MASGDLAAMRRECARKQAQAWGAWIVALLAFVAGLILWAVENA